jgi:hypothetical protein
LKKKEYFYGDKKRDSNEEIEFNMWLDEAKFAGFVIDYEYQPEPYVITPTQTYPVTQNKVKKDGSIEIIRKEKTLLRPHSYQADYKVVFAKEFFERFPDTGLLNFREDREYIIDVKGSFDRNKSLSIFQINRKLVLYNHDTYVNKVVPEEFFKKTFVPLACAYMKNRKVLTRRSAYAGCSLLVKDL